MAKKTRIAIFVVLDLICFNASYYLAYWAGLSISAPAETQAAATDDMPVAATADMPGAYLEVYLSGFLILIIIKLLAMFVFSVYRIRFEYAGLRDFGRVALSIIACTLASVTGAALIGIGPALLPPVILFSLIFDMGLVMAIRAAYVRQVKETHRESEDQEEEGRRRGYTQAGKSERRIMIIGGRQAAADLITEMLENESLGMTPQVIIDNDENRIGDMLLGIEIAGGSNDIRLLARRHSIDEIIIARPLAKKRQIAALLRECVKTNCGISMLPLVKRGEGAPPLLPAKIADLRKPTIVDLLSRERAPVDHRKIGDQIRGRIVLVTGGAGVFGSELCRWIIRYRPRRLIALDMDEDGLTMLSMEMEEYCSAETEFFTVIASVRNAVMMRRVFSALRPHIVFHAAELKHIPIAETKPREAFLTNVLGLKTTCDLADEFAAEKFILCSTVRAGSATNVAAQCKRTAELYISEKNEKSRTQYTSVRFPNLIEGRANVIAVFEKQLNEGGPLTLTDKENVRSFISAEEAALMTLLAAAVSTGGEVYEIGPGETMGILELAEAMISLAGKKLGRDIGIVATLLRPGEQYFENAGPEIIRSPVEPYDRIWLTEDQSGARLPHWSQLWGKDENLIDDAAVKEILRLVFPTYKRKGPGSGDAMGQGGSAMGPADGNTRTAMGQGRGGGGSARGPAEKTIWEERV